MLVALRVGWLALPLTLGPSLAGALDDASTAVQVVAATIAWLAWGAVLVALLLPRTVSLTALRIATPAALAAAVWAAVSNGGDVMDIIAMMWTAAIAATVLLVPAVTDTFVDGSSYGPERRMALRVPGYLLIGPVQLTWAVTVAGIVSGPLLLASGEWLVGVLVTAAGALAALIGARAIHRLSRRWIVFVPAGVVLHDHFVLGEAVLFPRQLVRSLHPADRDSSATDATARALGLVLELELGEPTKIGPFTTDRLLFCAVRPGALLQEARARGFVASPPPTTTSPS